MNKKIITIIALIITTLFVSMPASAQWRGGGWGGYGGYRGYNYGGGCWGCGAAVAGLAIGAGVGLIASSMYRQPTYYPQPVYYQQPIYLQPRPTVIYTQPSYTYQSQPIIIQQ